MINTRTLVTCLAATVILGCGGDFSIPWSETTVPLPHNAGEFVYRQKGPHRAMVTLRHDASLKECWLPWRPWLRHINVYYYSDDATGRRVRLQDHLNEVVIDFQKAKTYLLVRTPDRQAAIGEILSVEDGSASRGGNNGPWAVEVGRRKAENVTGSVLATDNGQYIGRIEVTENKRSGLDPVVLRFVPVEESPEQPIKRDE